MSSKFVELDQLHLTNTADNLQLAISSTATFQISNTLSGLGNEALAEALVSRKLWATRGVDCRLDVGVLLNEKPIPEESRIHLLETMGYGIRDIEMWTHVALLASLEIPTRPHLPDQSADFSILLKNGTQTLAAKKGQQAWSLDNINVSPPDSIRCVTFTKLRIGLKFTTQSLAPKKIKIASTASTEHLEGIWLDVPQNKSQKKEFRSLQNVVADMQGLPGSIAKLFDGLDMQRGLMLDPKTSSHNPTTSKPARSMKGQPFSKEIIGTVKVGINQHGSRTYLNKTERVKLMEEVGLENSQVKNSVRKLNQNRIDNEKTILSSSLSDPTLQELEEMLLVSEDESTPSLVSTPSTVSIISIKRPLEGSDDTCLPGYGFSVETLSKLVNAAIRIIVAGHASVGQRRLEDIKIKKPPTEISLANLAPAIFCPGYMEGMAHNARFLPSISNAISSCSRYVQSPSLRIKLAQLSIELPSTSNAAGGITGQLSAVVQVRLWKMMQAKLYDRASMKKLWLHSSETTKENDQDTLDLFADIEEDNTDVIDSLLEDFEDFEDFKDLFEGSEEEDLLDDEARERLAVEEETDQMLLGNEDDVEEDFLLLDRNIESEIMLL